MDLRGIFRLSTAFRKGFIIMIMKLSFFLGFLKSILQYRRYTLKKKILHCVSDPLWNLNVVLSLSYSIIENYLKKM